jgi:putative hydroxymethylpyrimidine transport system substrate-binding protein
MTRLTALTLAALLASTLALGACGKRQDQAGTPQIRSLRVILDYLPNADHIGIYMAKARGEFRKAGLDVQIQTPSDPAAPLKLLAAGRADIAVTYQPELLLARDKGVRVLGIGALAQRPLTSLMTVKGRPVSPAALKGRRVGTAGIPYQDKYLDAILAKAGVDPATVRRVDVGFNLIPAMLSGRVDATLGAFWNIEGVQLRLEHRRPRTAPVDPVGVPPYDELVLASRYATIQHDGELLRRFWQALQRGTRAAQKDPAAAAAVLRGAVPGMSPAFAAASVRATLPVLFPDDAGRPFGFQNLQQWQDYADWMRRGDLLTRPVDVGTVATNEFLPGEGIGNAGASPVAG